MKYTLDTQLDFFLSKDAQDDYFNPTEISAVRLFSLCLDPLIPALVQEVSAAHFDNLPTPAAYASLFPPLRMDLQ